MVSLNFSLLFSILFGLSTNFGLALLWRFLLGVSNGMLNTVKVLTAEFACGDSSLETRGAATLNIMWGWSLLISPALAGAVVQPIQQYPSYWKEHSNSTTYQFFESTPYFLANLISALLCLVSIALVNAFVQEPLPSVRFRDTKHLPRDIFTRLRSMLSTIQEEDGEDFALLSNSQRHPSMYGSTLSSSSDVLSPSIGRIKPQPTDSLRQFTEGDIQDAIRTSVMTYGNEEISPLTGVNARHDVVLAMAHQTSATVEEQLRRRNLDAAVPLDAQQPQAIQERDGEDAKMPALATFSSLWSTPILRNHLIVYWMEAFCLVALDEAIPLFLLARESGLALSAKAIGVVLSASSGLYCVSQYFVYCELVDWLGIYGSIKACFGLAGPLIAALPVVLLFKDKGAVVGATKLQMPSSTDDYASFSWTSFSNSSAEDSSTGGLTACHDLTWASLIYLSILLAAYRTFCLTAISSLTIALNRICVPEHRETLNRSNVYGSSITKTLGPAFGSIVVAFCLSSGLFGSATLAATFVFIAFAILFISVAIFALGVLLEMPSN
mmetsp:Transcript_25485/g.70385  ORF Transcript_25485/g.70385 Transcript_25485/m.70385 type:complete len:552 (+) Transcript_25485:1-1656(+)